jgi:superfamily II DNA helicase RecQ
MDIEKHEYFHAWLNWKKKKSGSYPSITKQKKALVDEYEGILLEKLVVTESSANTSTENGASLASDDVEIITIRRNKINKKIFVEFEDNMLISPEGKEIEFDSVRFGDIEEVFVTELTEKQTLIYQNKIKDIESAVDQNEKYHELQKKLFFELCKMRRKLATESHVPPYIIFDDKTLIDMAEIMPTSEPSMLEVTGIGETKFKKYGSIFIATIKKFKTDFNI